MSILDASAIIALLEREPGHQRVADIIAEGEAAVSAANLAEVAGRLVIRTGSAEEARDIVEELPIHIIELTRDLAIEAGLLLAATEPLGLSLGDRICLALARQENRPAITADRAWSQLDPSLGVSIELIR